MDLTDTQIEKLHEAVEEIAIQTPGLSSLEAKELAKEFVRDEISRGGAIQVVREKISKLRQELWDDEEYQIKL